MPALRAPVKDSGPYEWDYMTERLADEEPFWPPGTRNGYHGFTFGWTVGEMVRRASGKSLGTFFREEVAKPLGLDFWIGLPEEIEPRVAPITPYVYKAADAVTPFMRDLATDKQSIASLFFFNVGAWRTKGANARESHAAEIGAANGITNARGLAGMYAPLANGGGNAGRRQDARAHGRGLDGHARRRHLAHPHALRAGLHEVDGQPQAQHGGQAVGRGLRQRDPGLAPPSAMSAPAARWASPIPPPASPSATP